MARKQKKDYKFLLRTDPFFNWTKKEEIGDGSFGKVYSVTRNKDGQAAACKSCEVDNEMDMDDMAQEVQILLNCDHPYVLKAFEGYFHDGKIHMLLEMCDGGGLDDVIIEFENGLYEPFIQAVMLQMFQALNYLHGQDVIHRDIKAGNMLLTDKGVMKLADFGVSAVCSGNHRKRTTFIGTPYWMAPEVIACETCTDRPYDERCDVWSMGITCIELAESQPPNNEHHPMCVMFVILKNPPPTLQEPERWSETFIEFVKKCLTFDFQKRPNCEAMLKHKFLTGITDEQSRSMIRELYVAYKSDVIEEDQDDDETVDEIEEDLNLINDMSPGHSSSEKTSKTTNNKDNNKDPKDSIVGGGINLSASEDVLNNRDKKNSLDMGISLASSVGKLSMHTPGSGHKDKDKEKDKEKDATKRDALKTVKKTRRFMVNGELKTETRMVLVDSKDDKTKEDHTKQLAKIREQGMKELKRLKRLDQSEMEKRKDMLSTRYEETENKMNNERMKYKEKMTSEVENQSQLLTKEFAKKEQAMMDEQKKLGKKLKNEMEKEMKKFCSANSIPSNLIKAVLAGGDTASIVASNPAKCNPTSVNELIKIRQNVAKIFLQNLASQARDLTECKTQLINAKYAVVKQLECDLWAIESRQLQELMELKTADAYEMSALAFWQNLRQFNSELTFSANSFNVNMDNLKKEHAFQQKEMPKKLRNQLKQRLEAEKKSYRKQLKNGLLGSTQNEKEYLKKVHQDELTNQTHFMNEFRQKQVTELDQLNEAYAAEQEELKKIQCLKQQSLAVSQGQVISKVKARNEKFFRDWISKLAERKAKILVMQEDELVEARSYQIKSGVEFFNKFL